jgi:hypothetical protein
MTNHVNAVIGPIDKRKRTFGPIISHITDWLTPPPRRVPLLPDVDLTKAPSTSRLKLKRKVNTAFITSDGRAPKRQIIYTTRNSEPGGPVESNKSSGAKGGVRSDSETDRSTAEEHRNIWTEFDHILPPRRHSADLNIVNTTKKSDGTWQIQLEPDLKDVMKLDITKYEVPGLGRTFGGLNKVRTTRGLNADTRQGHNHSLPRQGLNKLTERNSPPTPRPSILNLTNLA